MVTPYRVGAGAAPALVSVVHDVIVVERAQVQHLDGCGGEHCPVIGRHRRIRKNVVREQSKGGTDQATGRTGPFLCERVEFGPALDTHRSQSVTDPVQVRLQTRKSSRVNPRRWHCGLLTLVGVHRARGQRHAAAERRSTRSPL